MAKSGDSEALCHLAGCYFYGEKGLERDEHKAVLYFEKAAKKGHPVAMCCLALAYLDGKGVAQNKLAAAEFFKKAALLGDGNAHCCLGKMYLRGEGVPRSVDMAVQWFQKGQQLGEVICSRYLDQIRIDHREGLTPGLPHNNKEAVEVLHSMSLTPGGRGHRVFVDDNLPEASSQSNYRSSSPNRKGSSRKPWNPETPWQGRQTSGGWYDHCQQSIQELRGKRHVLEPRRQFVPRHSSPPK